MSRGGRRVKLKLADKPRSLFMLVRHLGLFPRGREAEGVRAGEMAETRELTDDLERAHEVLRLLASARRQAAEADGEAVPAWARASEDESGVQVTIKEVAGRQGGETGYPEP